LYFSPNERKKFKDQLERDGFVKDFQSTLKSKDGREIIVLETVTTDHDKNGNVTAYRGILRDVTEQKRLEKQLLHAQKMEAMGTLAGGIAHDFNNILSAILGYAEITKGETEKDTRTHKNLEQIYKAGIRAKELVAQILTFSRKTEQELKPVKIENIIKEALKLLRASLPATIDIRENIEMDCGVVLGDPTQIHQIIMNLCTNAYDAMRETGGILEISLSAVNVDKEFYKEDLVLPEGEYLRLSVKDEGHGMEPHIVQRIFDPFFTTKAPGSGTGMGLSVVHGIVNSHKGAITVSSKENEGSIFNVYLPRHDESLSSMEKEISEDLPMGNGRILLVDDEEAIVQTSREILERLGYTVTATTSSNEALELFQTKPNEFDLVITDQTMPKLTGADLAKEIMNIQPNTPVILITGYSEVVTPEKAKQMGIREYIRKPISTFYLAKRIKAVLENQKN
jgi:signal transduction histidine kinase